MKISTVAGRVSKGLGTSILRAHKKVKMELRSFKSRRRADLSRTNNLRYKCNVVAKIRSSIDIEYTTWYL